MRKLIAAMKITLDGRSEGPQGYADWVDAWSDDYGLMQRVDACLLGGRMYPGYEQYWTAIQQAPDRPLPMTGKLPHPSELAWSDFAQRTPHYVLSTTLPSVAWPHARLLRHVNEVVELKAGPGKDIYLMGGATLVGSLMEAGLVDEAHFIVYPLLAGAARGPFDGVTRRRGLKLLSQHRMDGGLLRMAYQVQ
jgi:dihydrofolate reductase